jgi:hypothetical protein
MMWFVDILLLHDVVCRHFSVSVIRIYNNVVSYRLSVDSSYCRLILL